MDLRFEYDEAKSRSNREKHGIDFIEAQSLWLDEDMMEIRARTPGEARYVVLGRMAGKHWAAAVTYRGDAVRLISVRRARAKEVRLYEGR